MSGPDASPARDCSASPPSGASGEVLRLLSETLVELHGQHDDRGLLNPRGHRALLDAFAACDAELAATRAEFVKGRTDGAGA